MGRALDEGVGVGFGLEESEFVGDLVGAGTAVIFTPLPQTFLLPFFTHVNSLP